MERCCAISGLSESSETAHDAITDPAGNPLNGGLNTYVHWFPYMGKTFTYRDSDGDMVTLGLRAGPDCLIPSDQRRSCAAHFHSQWPFEYRTERIGKQARTGDGVAVIPELQGVATIQSNDPEQSPVRSAVYRAVTKFAAPLEYARSQ